MKKEFNILLIDDEPLARLSFRKLIETRFPGFEISGEAATGPEGLEMYRRLKPDIVIMDIQIPDLNGLETSRLILENHPSAQIIILTAYNQFDYAQDAINCGFLGYLLKPVHEDKLKNLLDKAVLKIRSFEDSTKKHKQFQAFKSIALKDMVSSFIYGSCGGLDASFYANQEDPFIEWGCFILFQLNTNTQKQVNTKDLDSYLYHLPGVFPGHWISNLLPIFIRIEPHNKLDENLAENIAHRLRILSQSSLSYGIGSVEKAPCDFPVSFNKALNQMESGSYQRDISVIEYPTDLEKRFIRDVLEEQWTGAELSLNNFFTKLSIPEYVLIDSQLALMEFIIHLRRSLEDKGNMNYSQLLTNLLRSIHLHQDRLSLLEWMASSLSDLLSQMKSSNSPEDLQIKKILKYIDLNDFQDISLESTARAVGLTPQYLSRIFKDRYKMNFIEYLKQCKVEFACTLLKESEISVKDIAIKTGYSDVGYFSKVFKKEIGNSPKEFRLMH